ncbi:hypothetical protein B0T24DRAFT_76791 [Lasiosphaeria ovina]|uniref:Uncharacterized protein n=1 Tax=Lasiosphaeria ovina TaxID=92902 RepID=A0AAE0NME7_9PEZI|nr:hypothetical protein B0T24DRAFT_76791 [Lasiosphaeria ovina]
MAACVSSAVEWLRLALGHAETTVPSLQVRQAGAQRVCTACNLHPFYLQDDTRFGLACPVNWQGCVNDTGRWRPRACPSLHLSESRSTAPPYPVLVPSPILLLSRPLMLAVTGRGPPRCPSPNHLGRCTAGRGKYETSFYGSILAPYRNTHRCQLLRLFCP